MGNLISSSSKKQQSVSEADRSMLALKAQRKRLVDQQRLLEARVDRHAEVARALVRENKKDRALLVLKKKRLVEKQGETLAGMVMNVEALVSSVETQQQQNKVFHALKQGNEALKQLQQAVTVDDVQRMMEDAAQAKAQYEEMSEVLGQSLSDVDTEQVEAELQVLEDQSLQQEAESLPSVPATRHQQQEVGTLPSVPTTAPQRQREQEVEEEAEEAPARAPMLAA
ncbi:Snf7-domain-containing protein [Dunaliella salina]|uniref:Snf7-domain-containing protein n=1 Tax=Dunaliella salina TaxID=3046 RepID=A0ABQ7G5Y8_DUNSA|nr:Snf7-domain-containing protein [Dunaliella salina]|eukprot:KAF5830031.1 Snf7-domain-containing protein [Dunaliella salina]